MNITKFLKAIIVILFIGCIMPATSNAMRMSNAISSPLSDSAADVKTAAQIVQRVNEIQSMDKTNLSSTEKRALRNELKDMKAKADTLGKGVYLSIGAIIVVILLLILILK